MTSRLHDSGLQLDFAPYRLSGTVYGTLLNHQLAWKALAAAMDAPPYKGPPKAPVLYVKPRNAFARSGDTVTVPAEVSELEVGAALGIIIGIPACRVSEPEALAHVAGYALVNDISQPHPDYYRPAIRFKARDGFCPIGPASPRSSIAHPESLRLRVMIDNQLACEAALKDMRRSVQSLLADVTDFMTLSPGDILMLGAIAPAPRVKAGQTVRICAEGLGDLVNTFVGVGT
jgi:5-oxopent-3-ene-1,2,5-tricarboxylate decarboxylase/2-hydroxyhepta-2,4-diene-1,7-dioate isomerase